MIRVDIINITQKQYMDLMNYFIACCDEVSFHFPGVDSDGAVLSDGEWQEYQKNIKPLLLECLDNGAKRRFSKHYCDMKLGDYSIIIYVKLYNSIKQKLCNCHLYDWLHQNNLPEDVCLYSKKKQRVFSCSHDEEFFISNETAKDKEFLKSNGFRFWIQ